MTFSYPTDDQENRVRGLVRRLIGIEKPDDMMMEIMETLTEGSKIPTAGKFYTFVYIPKTPNIQYDQNPLVAVSDVFQWGFRGMNFHWGEHRQYTWSEIVGGLYEVFPDELQDMIEIPYGYIRLNN